MAIELCTPFRSRDMQLLSSPTLRFQMANIYRLCRILLGRWALTVFFGVTRDPIGHIGEGIVWLPFLSQIDPIFPLLLLQYIIPNNSFAIKTHAIFTSIPYLYRTLPYTMHFFCFPRHAQYIEVRLYSVPIIS